MAKKDGGAKAKSGGEGSGKGSRKARAENGAARELVAAAGSAVVVGGSAAARQRAEAARPQRLTRREVGRVVGQLGGGISKRNQLGEPHVTLSAQVPWVEGRGYLNLINPQSFFADSPNVGFIAPFDGNVEGEVEVWLLGLEPSGTYFVELRVGSYSLDFDTPGQWEIRSSEGAAAFTQASGPGQTIPVVLHEVSGPMALLKLTSTGLGGWVFYDVQVAALT